ncbi:pilus assembly protein TadG-related protein [Paractinoplanes atraurantiacus]|uniref:Putative Flp pilus-assembly TadE/G-like n=1 Tax=Paractinoplanes atraurantiacus TaxID=1036182 RepID=A0A285I436_9ACTN|nr:Tad domain-containing protein [Actinoplanes atraurantiacus]SNY41826.1 Putative Flp pilus-assembly TadE/G-like [Actinoplanes atraurantiacus]
MHGLTSLIPRASRDGEPGDQGAIAVVVALFLSMGILLGMGAIVIDIGLLYAEREQLQSGADAGSWKVAQACVLKKDDCTVAAQTVNAGAYAVKNAKDGYADAQICLDNANCPATWNTTTTCRPQPATTGVYHQVEVRTSTRNPNNTTLVPPRLAQTLVGGSYTGKKVGACARVAWGVPASATVLALTISKCDWERITKKGTEFFQLPILDPLLGGTGLFPLLGLEAPRNNAVPVNNGILSVCKNTPADTLAGNPSGYAWLTPSADANCRTTIAPSATTDLWMYTGLLDLAGAIKCTNAMKALVQSGQAVLVPIFDKMIGALNLLPAAFHIVGFAPFVITGFKGLISGLAGTLSSLVDTGLNSLESTICGLQLCIYGYFTKSVITQSFPTTFGTSPDYGVQVIGRTG